MYDHGLSGLLLGGPCMDVVVRCEVAPRAAVLSGRLTWQQAHSSGVTMNCDYDCVRPPRHRQARKCTCKLLQVHSALAMAMGACVAIADMSNFWPFLLTAAAPWPDDVGHAIALGMCCRENPECRQALPYSLGTALRFLIHSDHDVFVPAPVLQCHPSSLPQADDDASAQPAQPAIWYSIQMTNFPVITSWLILYDHFTAKIFYCCTLMFHVHWRIGYHHACQFGSRV